MSKKNNKIDIVIMQTIFFAFCIMISVIVAIVNNKLINLTIIISVISILSAFVIFLREINKRKYNMKEIKTGFGNALKSNIEKLNIPMAIISKENELIWQNEKSKKLLNKNNFKEFLNNLKDNKDNIIELNDEIYDINISNINFKNSKYLFLTFINKSRENELLKEMKDTKINVGILFIDNFDETFQGIEEIDKVSIISSIDNLIRTWIFSNNGVINKIEKDKYVFFIQNKYVEKLVEEKFKILDEVKELTDKTKLPVTMSMGISVFEKELSERYSAANTALDIALGRGGDQVVIKKNKKFDFYGNTNEMIEKTFRVRARTISDALKELIGKSEDIYIVGHKNTDVDCLGGAIGVYKIAKSLDKNVKIIVDTKYNNSTKLILDKFLVLPEYQNVFLTKEEFRKEEFKQENSLLVVVDTHKQTYLSTGDITNMFDKIVVIDHHRRGTEYIDNATINYHEIYASSTCEMVTELIMYNNNIELSVLEAETLYSGILVDTKNFSFKTGVRTFEVAAYLKKFGIDIIKIKEIFQNDFDTFVAKAEIIKNSEIINNNIAIAVCEKELKDVITLVAQTADELLGISEILASFVLCKVDGVVMISARSTGDINVQEIMEKLGGGGHLTFAGAQIENKEIEEVKQQLINIINKYTKE